MDEVLDGFESFAEEEGGLGVALGGCLGVLGVGELDGIEDVRRRGRVTHCYNKFVIN